MFSSYPLTASAIHRIRQSAILETIGRSGPLSRSEIAQILRIRPSSVVRIIDELIEDGLVLAKPQITVRGGHPRTLLEFNAHEHAVKGIVAWAPGLNWRDFPLKDRLSKHFGMAVTVDNDVNLVALGELWFGEGQNTRNMVFIAIGTGIGAGLILDGVLYRGAHQASGELGYLLPGPQFLGRAYERFGAFEGLASGIAERARKTLKGQWKPAALEKLSAEDVFEAMRRGKAWAEALIAETVDYLASRHRRGECVAGPRDDHHWWWRGEQRRRAGNTHSVAPGWHAAY